MPNKGLFIAVEGLDGSGKSTQAMKLVEFIFSKYKKIDSILLTHEPTHSKFGAEISQRLSEANRDPSSHSKERMLELFVLDREDHVDTMIAPALSQKAVVICDRYKYSTIAYQSAQGVPIAHAIEENAGFPIPDITLLFNISIENAVARLEKTGKELDKFEKAAFLEKVKDQYLKLPALLAREKIVLINANATVDQVHADVVRAVSPLLDAIIK